MNWIMQFEILGEVALAMLLGGVIGVEREVTDSLPDFVRRCWWLELRLCSLD